MKESYHESWLSTRGLSDYGMAAQLGSSAYIFNALVAYLAYGFIMGGIVALGYSVYHFDLEKLHEQA